MKSLIAVFLLASSLLAQTPAAPEGPSFHRNQGKGTRSFMQFQFKTRGALGVTVPSAQFVFFYIWLRGLVDGEYGGCTFAFDKHDFPLERVITSERVHVSCPNEPIPESDYEVNGTFGTLGPDDRDVFAVVKLRKAGEAPQSSSTLVR